MDHRAKPRYVYYLGSTDANADEDVDDDVNDSTRYNHAKCLISILCKTNGKDILDNIVSQKHDAFKNFDIHTLQELCKAHPQCFTIRTPTVDGSIGESVVEVVTDVRICPMHAKKAGSCPDDGECDRLHVCKFFMLSGKCEYGGARGKIRCRFGHLLGIHHNNVVLKRRLMDDLAVDEVRSLLRRRSARTRQSRPITCHFYNRRVGCGRGASCTALHVCRCFLVGECKFGGSCKRNHDLHEPGVRSILDQYAIDPDELLAFMTDNQQEVKSRTALPPPPPSTTTTHTTHTTTTTTQPQRSSAGWESLYPQLGSYNSYTRYGESSALSEQGYWGCPISSKHQVACTEEGDSNHSQTTEGSVEAENARVSGTVFFQRRRSVGETPTPSACPETDGDDEGRTGGGFASLNPLRFMTPVDNLDKGEGIEESQNSVGGKAETGSQGNLHLMEGMEGSRNSVGTKTETGSQGNLHNGEGMEGSHNSVNEKTETGSQGKWEGKEGSHNSVGTKTETGSQGKWEGKEGSHNSVGVKTEPGSQGIGQGTATETRSYISLGVSETSAVASSDSQGNLGHASDDALVGKSQDFSYIPLKTGDKTAAGTVNPLRPVASVPPQVKVKVKPELGNCATRGIPKPSEEILFGCNKREEFKAKTSVDGNSEEATMEGEKAKASSSAFTTGVGSNLHANGSTEKSVSAGGSSTQPTNDLNSIIADLISNVKKLHSTKPGPESHLVSFLSELAEPKKLKEEVRNPEVDKENVRANGNTMTQQESVKYLSDGEISESDLETETIAAGNTTVPETKKLLFEYNHRPASDMIGDMVKATRNSSENLVVAESPSHREQIQRDAVTSHGHATVEKSGPGIRGGGHHSRTRSSDSKARRLSSGRKLSGEGKRGVEYDTVDSPEVDLEIIDSSDDYVSDIQSEVEFDPTNVMERKDDTAKKFDDRIQNVKVGCGTRGRNEASKGWDFDRAVQDSQCLQSLRDDIQERKCSANNPVEYGTSDNAKRTSQPVSPPHANSSMRNSSSCRRASPNHRSSPSGPCGRSSSARNQPPIGGRSSPSRRRSPSDPNRSAPVSERSTTDQAERVSGERSAFNSRRLASYRSGSERSNRHQRSSSRGGQGDSPGERRSSSDPDRSEGARNSGSDRRSRTSPRRYLPTSMSNNDRPKTTREDQGNSTGNSRHHGAGPRRFSSNERRPTSPGQRRFSPGQGSRRSNPNDQRFSPCHGGSGRSPNRPSSPQRSSPTSRRVGQGNRRRSPDRTSFQGSRDDFRQRDRSPDSFRRWSPGRRGRQELRQPHTSHRDPTDRHLHDGDRPRSRGWSSDRPERPTRRDDREDDWSSGKNERRGDERNGERFRDRSRESDWSSGKNERKADERDRGRFRVRSRERSPRVYEPNTRGRSSSRDRQRLAERDHFRRGRPSISPKHRSLDRMERQHDPSSTSLNSHSRDGAYLDLDAEREMEKHDAERQISARRSRECSRERRYREDAVIVRELDEISSRRLKSWDRRADGPSQGGGSRERSVGGSVLDRLGPSPVPFENTEDTSSPFVDGSFSGRELNFDDVQSSPLLEGDSFPRDMPGEDDEEDTCDGRYNNYGKNPPIGSKRFANYQEWKRALVGDTDSNRDNLNSSLTEPEVDLRYTSQSEEEDGLFAPHTLHRQNRWGSARDDQPISDSFSLGQRGSDISCDGRTRLGSKHNRRENDHRNDRRHGRFDASSPHRRHQLPDYVDGGPEQQYSPGKFHDDKFHELRIPRADLEPDFGERGDSRYRRGESEELNHSADGSDVLSENIDHFLCKARQTMPSPRSDFLNMESDHSGNPRQADFDPERVHQSPGQPHFKRTPRSNFTYHKRGADNQAHSRLGHTKRQRMSPAVELGEGTSHQSEHRTRGRRNEDGESHVGDYGSPLSGRQARGSGNGSDFHGQSSERRLSRHSRDQESHKIFNTGNPREESFVRTHPHHGHSEDFRKTERSSSTTGPGRKFTILLGNDRLPFEDDAIHADNDEEPADDEQLPPYEDLDQPCLEDGDRPRNLHQRLGEEQDFGDEANYDDFSQELDDNSADVGDLIDAQRARVRPPDLRQLLRRRRRSRPFVQAVEEPIQIRVRRQKDERAQRGKYLDDSGRQVTVAIHQ